MTLAAIHLQPQPQLQITQSSVDKAHSPDGDSNTVLTKSNHRRVFIAGALGVSSVGLLGSLWSFESFGPRSVNTFDAPPASRHEQSKPYSSDTQRIAQDDWCLWINTLFVPHKLDELIAKVRANPGRFAFNYAQVLGEDAQARKMHQFTNHHSLRLEEITFKSWAAAHHALSKGVVDMFFAPSGLFAGR